LRARDLGIRIGRGEPGPHNAITDVPGVRIGHATIIRGEGPLRTGDGPVRTGVTVILPHEGQVWTEPLFAGSHRLNGNGEMTGLEWVRESGMLTSPIAITNTHSVGVVRDALIAVEARSRQPHELFWGLPVVAETWDGMLNDVNGQHVRPEHVERAMASAGDGPVPEGSVGGGTGMICHGFKGGIGTSSRVVAEEDGGFVVGVLVQANHGRRERLQVNGVRVGEAISASVVPLPGEPAGSPQGAGSIIGVVATDAPLIPTQCDRLAQRVGLGVARTGGVGEHWSGDLFFAFSTANRGIPSSDLSETTARTVQLTMLSNTYVNALFDAVVEATEESILNALLAAESMTGRDGITAHALDPDRLLAAIGGGGRIA
jgi:D-aminopeptidase